MPTFLYEKTYLRQNDPFDAFCGVPELSGERGRRLAEAAEDVVESAWRPTQRGGLSSHERQHLVGREVEQCASRRRLGGLAHAFW